MASMNLVALNRSSARRLLLSTPAGTAVCSAALLGLRLKHRECVVVSRVAQEAVRRKGEATPRAGWNITLSSLHPSQPCPLGANTLKPWKRGQQRQGQALLAQTQPGWEMPGAVP